MSKDERSMAEREIIALLHNLNIGIAENTAAVRQLDKNAQDRHAQLLDAISEPDELPVDFDFQEYLKGLGDKA